MRLTIDVAGAGGIPVLDRNLARFQQKLTDVQPALEAMASAFAKAEAEQFSTEGQKASGGWAALSPGYAIWKERNFPGKPILERTGELKKSLTQRPFGVEVISTMAMEIGTRLPYAVRHQQGGTHLPKRPPVALNEASRREITQILQKYIVLGHV